MDQNERNGLQEIIDNALAEMAEEVGEGFDCFRYAIFEHIAEQDLIISTRDMPTTAIR